jgi:hypothetical protein
MCEAPIAPFLVTLCADLALFTIGDRYGPQLDFLRAIRHENVHLVNK